MIRAKGAAGYDAYMGRWSRRLATPFLEFAGIEPGETVADIGCGTGSLTFAIASSTAVAKIQAIDFEPDFVSALLDKNEDPRIEAQQGDACALPFKNAAFDRAFSMLVLHFVSNADAAINEMRRVLRSGGVGAAAVWDTYGGVPSLRMFWDIVAAIEPTAAARRSATAIRPMARGGELRDAFLRAGFVNVVETILTIRMDFANFDDYWQPLLTGQGTLREFLASLSDTTRARIETAVRDAYLCGLPDGPRSFASVAWAVRGNVI